MICNETIGRRTFLATSAAATAATLLGGTHSISAADTDALPTLHLKSWEVVDFPARKEKFRFFIKIMSDNGAVGYCRALGDVKDIRNIWTVLTCSLPTGRAFTALTEEVLSCR